MTTISQSVRNFETWLAGELGDDLVKDDLREKHEKMRSDDFVFLRATYWRWCEIILDICPELGSVPEVLAIGDTHLENFGTWRDIEGRLVWGVNDFDDAAVMPYALDLVRLAASAILARGEDGPSVRMIGELILSGYRRGLENPLPVILERDHKWLRKALMPSAWSLRHRPQDMAIHVGEIANGRARCVDPHYQISGRILVRRLSPNSCKIEIDRHSEILLSPTMLELMGFEIANCHSNDAAATARILQDIKTRGNEWLHEAARAAASSVSAEQKAYSRGG